MSGTIGFLEIEIEREMNYLLKEGTKGLEMGGSPVGKGAEPLLKEGTRELKFGLRVKGQGLPIAPSIWMLQLHQDYTVANRKC